MRNWKRHVVIAAVILAAAAILGAVAQPVWAQVRAALVKDADNPARQPFSASSSSLYSGSSSSAAATLLIVPSGKRAVVQHLSCINYLAVDNSFVRFEMLYIANGVAARHQFVNTHVGTSFVASADIWSFSQPVHAYADPGTEISVNALRRSSAGLGGLECDVSGYYVDMTP